MMTDQEIDRELRKKWKTASPQYKRKSKLKMRYGRDPQRLANEINRTNEKLRLLREIATEQAA